MNPSINFANLVRQLLPNHKRQPVRLFLLRAFVSPLIVLFLSFDKWRDNIRIEMNMTGQIGAIQGYLRTKYNDETIRIDSSDDRSLGIGLEEEGETHAARISLMNDIANTPALIPLNGEIQIQFDDMDFIVYVPLTFDERTIEAVRIDVDRYKQALVKYKIIQA